jgi:hypothetical protein
MISMPQCGRHALPQRREMTKKTPRQSTYRKAGINQSTISRSVRASAIASASNHENQGYRRERIFGPTQIGIWKLCTMPGDIPGEIIPFKKRQREDSA